MNNVVLEYRIVSICQIAELEINKSKSKFAIMLKYKITSAFYAPGKVMWWHNTLESPFKSAFFGFSFCDRQLSILWGLLHLVSIRRGSQEEEEEGLLLFFFIPNLLAEYIKENLSVEEGCLQAQHSEEEKKVTRKPLPKDQIQHWTTHKATTNFDDLVIPSANSQVALYAKLFPKHRTQGQ